MLPRTTRFGDLRRRMLSWWRRTRISACNAARNRNRGPAGFRTTGKCGPHIAGLSQIAAAQFLHVYNPRNWINCGQAGPLGWTIPAALGVRAADPTRRIVALSGDYDFQFMIEELAVGAQFKLPYIHIVVNNSYLGLIRQAQRGFNMDYCVSLADEAEIGIVHHDVDIGQL